MQESKSPRVFISYAKNEIGPVLSVAEELKQAGASVWLDRWNLVQGDMWESEVESAVKSADAFVPCLSNEYNSNGYRQKEIRLALEAADRRPLGRGFIVPYILEPCKIPAWCGPINVGNPGERTSIPDLLRGIDRHCESD